MATRERSAAAPAKKTRPPATLNNADWMTSKAKQLIAQDIIDGEIPLEGNIDVEKIFYGELGYHHHKYFKNFPFDKTRYKDRIERLREAIKRLQHWAAYDAAKIEEDRIKHPPKEKNIRGELRWDGSEAQALLKLDMDQGRHLQMRPKEFRETREAYGMFKLRIFQKHVDQEKQARKDYDEATKSKRYKSKTYGNKELSRNSATSANSS